MARQAPRQERPRPRAVGGPAPEFAIDEIRDPAEEKPDRHRGGDETAKTAATGCAAGKQRDGERAPREPAMERHAAMPERQDLRGC